jgi:chromate transporter
MGELRELFLLFTKLGFVAFGGPAAHVAMMRQEVVTRRGWMDDQEFLDLNGATNLIPGPNSTELAIHIGRERAGWRGLLVAGTCFIVPATMIVLAFAIAYKVYGSTSAGKSLLYVITPVVVAVVVQALWGS